MELAAYKEMAELESHHWWFVGRRSILGTLLAKLPLKKNARVLEIGCGSGGNLEMLSAFGNVSGAEYDEGARIVAQERRIAPVEHCELPDELPYGGEEFDLIVAFDVLEHVERDVDSLKAIRDRLAPGGWLVMTVPMFPFLWSSHDVYNHHFRRYRRSELNQKLASAGFKPNYQGYFNFWLFPIVAATRGVRNIFGARDVTPKGDLSVNASKFNTVLTHLFASERFAMGRFSLPFGVSYVVSAQPVPQA